MVRKRERQRSSIRTGAKRIADTLRKYSQGIIPSRLFDPMGRGAARIPAHLPACRNIGTGEHAPQVLGRSHGPTIVIMFCAQSGTVGRRDEGATRRRKSRRPARLSKNVWPVTRHTRDAGGGVERCARWSACRDGSHARWEAWAPMIHNPTVHGINRAPSATIRGAHATSGRTARVLQGAYKGRPATVASPSRYHRAHRRGLAITSSAAACVILR